MLRKEIPRVVTLDAVADRCKTGCEPPPQNWEPPTPPEDSLIDPSVFNRYDVADACPETLAYCKCGVIYYLVDRINDWISSTVQTVSRNLQRLARDSEENGFNDASLYLVNLSKEKWWVGDVRYMATLYLKGHEMAHCAGIYDEGMATAWGLCQAFAEGIAPLIGLKPDPVSCEIPIQNPPASVYHVGSERLLIRYLTLLSLAGGHYRMPGYADYVHYLVIPIARVLVKTPPPNMEIEISYRAQRRPQNGGGPQAIVFKIQQSLRSLSFDATPRQPYKFYYRGKKPQAVEEVLEVSAKCNNGMNPTVPWPL